MVGVLTAASALAKCATLFWYVNLKTICETKTSVGCNSRGHAFSNRDTAIFLNPESSCIGEAHEAERSMAFGSRLLA